MTGNRLPHMLLVSQKVVDIKPPTNLHRLAQTMGEVRAYLHRYSFIPGDKVTGELTLHSVDQAGNVSGELTGSSLGSDAYTRIKPSIKVELPLELLSYTGKLEVPELFGTIPQTTVDDGGNIQNMLMNVLHLTVALERRHPEFSTGKFQITAASSSDPLARCDSRQRELYGGRVNFFPLGLPDRRALHLPWSHDGNKGTLGITSQPALSESALIDLLEDNPNFARAFRAATCLVSSDPFFGILPRYARLPYAYIINASTAFRAMVAVHSYGHSALLPMNEGEAGEVCKLMLSQGRGVELKDTETPPFPSPLSIRGDGLDLDSLRLLDESLDKLVRYNPPHRMAEGLAFACPISFGREGGMIVATNDRVIGCFTSIVAKDRENSLFSDYSVDQTSTVHETGAGDSVAAINALFNTVSPETIIETFLEGGEKDHRDLRHLSATIFVSALGRIVGNLLIRTTGTNLSYVDPDALGQLIEDVAQESVAAARTVIRRLPQPVHTVIERWGIRIAIWTPRQVAFPGGTPATIG